MGGICYKFQISGEVTVISQTIWVLCVLTLNLRGGQCISPLRKRPNFSYGYSDCMCLPKIRELTFLKGGVLFDNMICIKECQNSNISAFFSHLRANLMQSMRSNFHKMISYVRSDVIENSKDETNTQASNHKCIFQYDIDIAEYCP